MSILLNKREKAVSMRYMRACIVWVHFYKSVWMHWETPWKHLVCLGDGFWVTLTFFFSVCIFCNALFKKVIFNNYIIIFLFVYAIKYLEGFTWKIRTVASRQWVCVGWVGMYFKFSFYSILYSLNFYGSALLS